MARSLMSALLGGLPGVGGPGSSATPSASRPGGPTTIKMLSIADRAKARERIVRIDARDLDNITIRRFDDPEPKGAPEPKKTDLVSRKIDEAMKATVDRLMEGLDKGISLVISAPQGGENDMAQAATFAGFDPLVADLMFQPPGDPKSQTIFTYCESAAEEAAARASGVRMFGEVKSKPKADTGPAFVAVWRDEDSGDICMMSSPVNVMKGLKRDVEEALPNRTQISWSYRAQMSLLQAHEMEGAARKKDPDTGVLAAPTHACADLREAFFDLGKDGNFALKGDPEQPELDGLDMLRRDLNRSKRLKLSRSPAEDHLWSPAAVT